MFDYHEHFDASDLNLAQFSSAGNSIGEIGEYEVRFL